MIRSTALVMVSAAVLSFGCARRQDRPEAVPVFRVEQKETRESQPARAQAELRQQKWAADLAVDRRQLKDRLGHWTFDAEDFSESNAGRILDHTGARLVPSFDGRALLIDGPVPARAVYAATRQDGQPLIGRKEGGIRFWYKPFWFSDGAGPGDWARLLEWDNLRISITPDGRQFVVETRGHDGRNVTNLIAQCFFPRHVLPVDSNFYWHEIIWNYYEQHSAVVIDGRWQKNMLDPNGDAPGWDGAGEYGKGLSIGSDREGRYPAHGMIDELETFSRSIRPMESHLLLGDNFLRVRLGQGRPAIGLEWRNVAESTNGCVRIRRRRFGSDDWQMLTNSCRTSWFEDASVEPGERYEYRVGDRYVLAGWRARALEDRGTVLLIVDETVAADLKPELEQLRLDLHGDGWQVGQRLAGRHDDANWARNTNAIVELRRWITAQFNADPSGVKSVFLVGHVVVPYSGVNAEDGHFLPASNGANHQGAWAADSYYGDLRGEWTDSRENYPNPFFPRLQNLPGDGKFDRDNFGTNSLQLAVGRVDFANMSATFSGWSETELLRRYLNKAHRYRHKQLMFPDRVEAATFFGDPFHNYGQGTYANAIRLASRNGALLEEADLFSDRMGALWGLQGGYGGYSFIHDAARQKSARLFAVERSEPSVAFYILAGSYFGDWDHSDDLLRATIGGMGSGLGAMYGFNIDWHFEKMGLGEPIGAGLVQTTEEPGRLAMSVRTIALMGDPTLRTPMVAPPHDLKATRRGGGLRLQWGSSPDPVLGYIVFRSEGSPNQRFRRLHAAPLSETVFTDVAAPAGKVTYQVRSAALTVTGSGSFTNLSQGIRTDVE